MKKLELTKEDFCQASKRLGCSVASLKAVWKVESKGTGFYADGFPTILFERHKFWKNADRGKRAEWFRLYPTICNPNATPRGHYGTKSDQRQKFSFAFSLDPEAAMMACSWGAFQELGENYDDYKFKTVGEFVDTMKSGADGQLEIFIRSIIRRGLTDELQRRDWAGFARNYNGPAYRKFDYDGQMKRAYDLYATERIDCSALPPETNVFPGLREDEIVFHAPEFIEVPQEPAGSPPSNPAVSPATEPVETGAQPATPIETVPDQSGATPVGDNPETPPRAWLNVEDWKPWVFSKMKSLWATFTGVNATQMGANFYQAINSPDSWWIYVAIAAVILVFSLIVCAIISVILLAIWYFNRSEIKDYIVLAKKSVIDPASVNLGLTFEKIK
jgi:hypothetical protein